MNGLPYYKRYPRDFIEGTLGMSFEVKGAYSMLLDLIYMQGGALRDDARYISGLLNVSTRKWKSLRNELIANDKIQVSGEFLTNYRAVSELETLSKLQEKQAENARGPRKNKDLQKPRQNHTEADTEADTEATNVATRTRADLDALEASLRDAANLQNNPSPNLFDLSPIIELLDAGVDLDRVILPKVRAMAARGRQVNSWRYFATAIASDLNGGNRQADSIPKMSPSGEPWETCLDMARKTQRWSMAWGPPPGREGCLVPAGMIEPGDGEQWKVSGEAA